MLSQLKLTVLSENRVVNPKLLAEQGLSIFIETPGGNILFDTGQMRATIQNAKQLGIDLKTLNKVFLSHGHFDHCGGLRYLISHVHPLEVICHPNLFNKKYRVIDGERVDIGV
ncbi:MAG: MBL fold metallo-hydrolase, partial [Calditrichia bacterium]